MKLHVLFAIATLGLCSIITVAQTTNNNQPQLKANSERSDVYSNGSWDVNRWRISPEIAHDTLNIKLYSSRGRVGFRTDLDSIFFEVKPGDIKSFYVKMGTAAPAHTVITASAYTWDKISYGNTPSNKNIQFFYRDKSSLYFDTLRKKYPVAQLLKKGSEDSDKVLTIMNWVHHRWKHDGGNSPKGSTGIAILDEAKQGGRFPCFAYAIVLVDQLTAQGYKARVLYLKTKDASTRQGSPGHVAAEVYLNDLKKWVFIDGQFNIMPMLKGKPLNAAEFQQALSQNYDQVILASRDKVSKPYYTSFVYDYLYYFDTALDNRQLPANKKFSIDGKSSAMLVPLGAPNLSKMDFFKSTVNYCVYTNSAKDFYSAPTANVSK